MIINPLYNLCFLLLAVPLSGFVFVPRSASFKGCRTTPLHLTMESFLGDGTLFEDDEEMIPIAEAFVHAKYKAGAKSHGHEFCTDQDARELLRGLLPPVSSEELEDEVSKTMAKILLNPKNSADKIDEDDFVKAIVDNSYWQSAGDIVVKELMYFEALHSFYRTGSSLLKSDDYDVLKENLTWEGSSVATMNAKEALFVTAVASSRRGEPIIDDEEYAALKSELRKQESWVTDREADNLEKLGLDTFLGYLHRAIKENE